MPSTPIFSDAEGLEPDEYELTWIVTDLRNGQIREQQFQFKVFESKVLFYQRHLSIEQYFRRLSFCNKM